MSQKFTANGLVNQNTSLYNMPRQLPHHPITMINLGASPQYSQLSCGQVRMMPSHLPISAQYILPRNVTNCSPNHSLVTNARTPLPSNPPNYVNYDNYDRNGNYVNVSHPIQLQSKLNHSPNHCYTTSNRNSLTTTPVHNHNTNGNIFLDLNHKPNVDMPQMNGTMNYGNDKPLNNMFSGRYDGDWPVLKAKYK